MAWNQTSGPNGVTLAKEADITLPASATTEYTTVLPPQIGPDLSAANRYVTFRATASAVSGTNLDIALYGAPTETGTKVLLLDAVVADLTDGTGKQATIDLNAYPAPFYFLGHLADGDESNNTITYEIFY